MTVRDRVRSNLFAHLVDAHGFPVRAALTCPPSFIACPNCWARARELDFTVRDSWWAARRCARRGR